MPRGASMTMIGIDPRKGSHPAVARWTELRLKARLFPVRSFRVSGALACLLLLAAGCGSPSVPAPVAAPTATDTVSSQAATTSVATAPAEVPESSLAPVSTIAEASLADITGFRIGDKITDGQKPNWLPLEEASKAPAPVELPEWVAVSIGDTVVGYFDNYPDIAHLTAEELTAAGNPDSWIYDESGNVIGRFVDGVPVLDEKGAQG